MRLNGCTQLDADPSSASEAESGMHLLPDVVEGEAVNDGRPFYTAAWIAEYATV